ncbi:MAG: glycosyltransferase family 2 protein [Candidatus Bathyarchaeota archaeon]|nr:glycosyltransferase family 2 protein [Candidatus Bathyarchaeum tardum]WGM89212.1 MAG: glycosyltransferase family 2 protein [Candidatus Bathyarchaeum tardum]
MFQASKRFPSVSVVIVNFNGKHLLKACLNTLLKTKYPNYDIVIVDNASTDRSLETIKPVISSDSRVKIVENTKNVGHSEGCNIGAQTSNGHYIVFVDSDIEFGSKNWLWELVNVMENDKSVGLAQAKIVLSENQNRLEYFCENVDALGTWSANYGSKAQEINSNFELLAASAGCCIIRRNVFNQIGGFDKDYFIYDDDTDLSFRARLLGYSVLFVSSSVVIHRSSVLRGVSGTMLYHSSKNRMHTAIKNYEFKNVCWRFPLLGFFTLVVSAGFFITKNHDAAKASLRGLMNTITDFKKIWTKRLNFQPKRNVKDFELVKKGFVRNDFRSTIEDLKIKLKHM